MFHLTQQGRLAQCYTIPTRDGLQIMLLDFAIEIIRKYGFLIVIYLFYFNWDSLHAKMNNHYKAWGYKKKHKKDYSIQESV